MVDDARIEREIQSIGQRIANALPARSRNPVAGLDEKAMTFASQDQEVKAALFRFVDVAPACRNLDDLAQHLVGFLGELDHPPLPLNVSVKVASTRAGRAALGAAAAAGVKRMAHRFIIGETAPAAVPVLHKLWKASIASSVDLLGEATVTDAEAQRYAARCEETLISVTEATKEWQPNALLERDNNRPLPRVNLSVKLSALTALLRVEAPLRGQRDAAERLRHLMRLAKKLDAHLHIDMESVDSRDPTLEVVLDLLAEPEFRAGPSAGVVLQAYLRDSPEMFDAIFEWSTHGPGRERARPLAVRLVKGAYWDHEVVQASQHGWSAPVFEDKAECDLNFEALTRRLIDARDQLVVAIASHNLRSLAHAIAYNRLTGGTDNQLELQVLRGLGDDLAYALASLRHRVRMYCPIGDLVAGMAYLVRRLLENTSNESFLFDQARGVALNELLARPQPTAQPLNH